MTENKMEKLEKLTDTQIHLMETVRNEWLGRLFVKRRPLQKKKAMKLIHWLYEFSKLQKPLVIFVDSPMAMQIAANILNWAQVWDQVWDQVRAQVGDAYSFAWYGSVSDFCWLAFYDFFDRLGLDLIRNENFHKFKALIQTNLYDMIQLDKFCIVCPIPGTIYRNEKNRLHAETAPAISWKDGYAQYYLHGIYLPKELWEKIVNRYLSFKECMAIENMEQRMIALKYLGADTLLEETHAQSIDKVRGYELFEIHDIFPTTQYFLKYVCPSTGRIYVSGIDPRIGEKKSAIDAMAWKFYLDDYEKDKPLFSQES